MWILGGRVLKNWIGNQIHTVPPPPDSRGARAKINKCIINALRIRFWISVRLGRVFSYLLFFFTSSHNYLCIDMSDYKVEEFYQTFASSQ